MKRQNLIYLALLPILYVIYQVHTGYSSESPFFYGFAENKETELSNEIDVIVSEIFVTQGQSVEAGEVLMKVESTSLTFAEENSEVASRTTIEKHASEIANLQGQKLALQTQLQSFIDDQKLKIEAVRLKDQRQKETLAALGVDATEKLGELSPKFQLDIDRMNHQSIEQEKLVSQKINLIDKRIVSLNSLLSIEQRKSNIKKDKLSTDRNALNILAPANGVIGNIPSKEGESIKSHTTLITFYRENPTLVKGYVHENLIVHVKLGDSLKIASTLRPENSITGEVVGLGSRIVEIPERLRKMATVKTYGREVLVQIPPTNGFLQKEKVSINSSSRTGYTPQRKIDRKLEKNLKDELSLQK